MTCIKLISGNLGTLEKNVNTFLETLQSRDVISIQTTNLKDTSAMEGSDVLITIHYKIKN